MSVQSVALSIHYIRTECSSVISAQSVALSIHYIRAKCSSDLETMWAKENSKVWNWIFLFELIDSIVFKVKFWSSYPEYQITQIVRRVVRRGGTRMGGGGRSEAERDWGREGKWKGEVWGREKLRGREGRNGGVRGGGNGGVGRTEGGDRDGAGILKSGKVCIDVCEVYINSIAGKK